MSKLRYDAVIVPVLNVYDFDRGHEYWVRAGDGLCYSGCIVNGFEGRTCADIGDSAGNCEFNRGRFNRGHHGEGVVCTNPEVIKEYLVERTPPE